MNLEAANLSAGDAENASRRRWQQVLDFGCPQEEHGQHFVRQAEAGAGPAFEVIP